MRKDDPIEARKAVEKEVRDITKFVRKNRGQMVGYGDGGLADLPPGNGEETLISFAIGARDKLTKAYAKTAGTAWREAIRRYPKAHFVVSLFGYDDDPREVWEFPEARRYVRQWARFAGLDDPVTADCWLGTGQGRLDKPVSLGTYEGSGLAFLGVCGVFGEEVQQAVLRNSKPPTMPQ
jgi:hypothetical protein